MNIFIENAEGSHVTEMDKSLKSTCLVRNDYKNLEICSSTLRPDIAVIFNERKNGRCINVQN